MISAAAARPICSIDDGNGTVQRVGRFAHALELPILSNEKSRGSLDYENF